MSDDIYQCKNCQEIFTPKDKKYSTFCSQSCSATYNNKKRTKNKLFWYCKNCGREHVTKKTYRIGIYCNHSCQHEFQRKEKIKDIIEGKAYHQTVKKYLLEKYGHQCNKCKNTTWNGLPIPLDLEHINGDGHDNRLENVELLCLNCHAQTPTYGAKNWGNGRPERRARYIKGLKF